MYFSDSLTFEGKVFVDERLKVTWKRPRLWSDATATHWEKSPGKCGWNPRLGFPCSSGVRCWVLQRI